MKELKFKIGDKVRHESSFCSGNGIITETIAKKLAPYCGCKYIVKLDLEGVTAPILVQMNAGRGLCIPESELKLIEEDKQ